MQKERNILLLFCLCFRILETVTRLTLRRLYGVMASPLTKSTIDDISTAFQHLCQRNYGGKYSYRQHTTTTARKMSQELYVVGIVNAVYQQNN